jgi:hypothetical protein
VNVIQRVKSAKLPPCDDAEDVVLLHRRACAENKQILAASRPDKPQELRSILVAKLPLKVNGVCAEVLLLLSVGSKKKPSKSNYGVCLARVKRCL